jgi:hypothetical protein
MSIEFNRLRFLWSMDLCGSINALSLFSTTRIYSDEATFSLVVIVFADVISDVDKGKSRFPWWKTGIKFHQFRNNTRFRKVCHLGNSASFS